MSRIVGVEVARYRVAGVEGVDDAQDFFQVVLKASRFTSYTDALDAGTELARIVSEAELECEQHYPDRAG